MGDLVAKVEYYLNHEEERRIIAENGNRRVREAFDLDDKVGEILRAI